MNRITQYYKMSIVSKLMYRINMIDENPSRDFTEEMNSYS